jgi:hypothetical protein
MLYMYYRSIKFLYPVIRSIATKGKQSKQARSESNESGAMATPQSVPASAGSSDERPPAVFDVVVRAHSPEIYSSPSSPKIHKVRAELAFKMLPLSPLLKNDAGAGAGAGSSRNGTAAEAQAPPSALLTMRSLGWGCPGKMDEIYEEWASMADLPLEQASRDNGNCVTAAEEASIPLLKAAILRRMGLDAPPTGFRSHQFTKWKLLCMLRARGGDVEASADRMMECLPALERAFEHARGYDKAPALHRELRETKMPIGIFGVDKRGAPIMWSRLGATDTVGFYKRTGIGFVLSAEWYTQLMLWNALVQANERTGIALQGNLWVIDVSGCSLWSALATNKVAKQIVADGAYPGGEHPIPEGMRKTLVCGAPSWVGRVWQFVKLLLPARTVAKISLYSASKHKEFLAELLERADVSQIPRWCGGEATEPWPYGEGGSI